MTKPPTVPEWASNSDYPAGSEAWSATPIKVEPTSGDKQAGWTPRQKPPAQTLNWWQYWVWQWLLWLDGLFDSDDNMTLPADSSFAVSGEGQYYHGTRTLNIPPTAGHPIAATDDSWSLTVSGDISWAAAATSWFVPIVLPAGVRITAIRFRSQCDMGTKIAMEFYVRRLGGLVDPGDDDDEFTLESAGSGAAEDTEQSGLTTVIRAGTNYQLYFETVTGVGATKLSTIEVDYDRLPP